MRYRVYDEEDKKERTLEECITPLEVGSVRRVQIKMEIPERYIILECLRSDPKISPVL